MIKNILVVFVFEPKNTSIIQKPIFSSVMFQISRLFFLHNLISGELLIHFYVTYFVESLFNSFKSVGVLYMHQFCNLLKCDGPFLKAHLLQIVYIYHTCTPQISFSAIPFQLRVLLTQYANRIIVLLKDERLKQVLLQYFPVF